MNCLRVGWWGFFWSILDQLAISKTQEYGNHAMIPRPPRLNPSRGVAVPY